MKVSSWSLSAFASASMEKGAETMGLPPLYDEFQFVPEVVWPVKSR